jgi:hypothetical protein
MAAEQANINSPLGTLPLLVQAYTVSGRPVIQRAPWIMRVNRWPPLGLGSSSVDTAAIYIVDVREDDRSAWSAGWRFATPGNGSAALWNGLGHIFRRVGMPQYLQFHGVPNLAPGSAMALIHLITTEWHRPPPTLAFATLPELRPHHLPPLEAASTVPWPRFLRALPAGFLTDMDSLCGPGIDAGAGASRALDAYVAMDDTDDERLEREAEAAEEPYVEVESSGTCSGHGSA